jgi:hypothetical protein
MLQNCEQQWIIVRPENELLTIQVSIRHKYLGKFTDRIEPNAST